MQSIGMSNYSYNNLDFSMQTSSGDTIDLRLYDEKSSEIFYEKNKNTTTTILSLSHSYGYNFNYEGNGIDAKDKIEIAQAMELVKPMMEKYFESVNTNDENPSSSDITNNAYNINSYLPKTEDLNTQNYLNNNTLNTIDEILKKAENQNQKILQEAQKLFEALLNQTNKFELYM